MRGACRLPMLEAIKTIVTLYDRIILTARAFIQAYRILTIGQQKTRPSSIGRRVVRWIARLNQRCCSSPANTAIIDDKTAIDLCWKPEDNLSICGDICGEDDGRHKLRLNDARRMISRDPLTSLAVEHWYFRLIVRMLFMGAILCNDPRLQRRSPPLMARVLGVSLGNARHFLVSNKDQVVKKTRASH